MNSIEDCNLIQWPDDQQSYDAAVNEHPDNAGSATGTRRKRSLINYSKLWANGRTLKIAFIDGPDAEHKQKIIDAASQWLPYINLKFEFVDDLQGEIRIATRNNDNSSMLGTDALLIHPDWPTMNLGVKPEHEDFEVIVTHEFGHALGAMHEHQHPEANIPWDKPKVYELYQNREMNPLTKEQIDRNLFEPFNTLEAIYTPYDRKSIMHHPVANTLTLGNWEIPINRKISKKDKKLMKLLYPKR
ncbi:M12 family metallopeptidase [Pseudomonas sp. UYIF39]|uniref:M12 family metallopeptidase n=1 Tax=Pseudomonas sp. UYIF39 TaxID=1630747 RepID=UPI00249E21BA|nr:M12 family metallopeptidase [Pseudomonas sp. UYIF39]MDI3357062.1 M12 family metallopeptidase [Pseudomonas sp. UYIF39]